MIATALVLVPIVLFVLLRWVAPAVDHIVAVPTRHFYIVSAACLIALGMAIVLSVAAVRSREPRTYFLAATYISLAAPFAVHGLMTPGQHFADGFYGSMSVSAQLSLVLGSVCIYMASRPLPPRLHRLISESFGPVMMATVLVAVAYILICLSFKGVLDWVPTGNERDGVTTMFGLDRSSVGWVLRLTLASIGVLSATDAALTFHRSFATTRSIATASVAISAALLAQSVFIQTFGVVWHYSWWIYHLSLFVAVMLPMAAISWLYARGSSLTEIVDSLLLTETLAKVTYSMPQVIDTLITSVEERDGHLEGHMRRVCHLSVAIADELAVGDTSVRAIGYASLLHDLGKLGMPPAILHKPGRLTDDEFAVLQEHPSRGFALVANIDALRIAAPAIRWHHERLDGTGYPDGLHGAEIPIEARVLAVADVWDALTSDRIYRSAMSTEDALRIVEAERGSKLDAACVDALFRVLSRERLLPAPVIPQTEILATAS